MYKMSFGKKHIIMELEYNVEQKENNTTIRYRFNTEIEPIINARLKLEINCREHFAVLGWNSVKHSIQNSYFSGNAEIMSFQLEELLGTKLRALYQRKKGRDLFDLYYALANANPDPDKILKCYRTYMEFTNNRPATSMEFLINMEDKMQDATFLGDINALIRPDVEFDINEAYEKVKQELIERI